MRDLRTTSLNVILLAVYAAKTVWSTHCVASSIRYLNEAEADGSRDEPGGQPICRVWVIVPMIHEGVAVPAFAKHWANHMGRCEWLNLCVVTTEREWVEATHGSECTWDALARSTPFSALVDEGRARVFHFPRVNRTYGEQLGWGVQQVMEIASQEDYFYFTNVDSRISGAGIDEIRQMLCSGADCAQQSSVFLNNFTTVTPLAAAEALYQSR